MAQAKQQSGDAGTAGGGARGRRRRQSMVVSLMYFSDHSRRMATRRIAGAIAIQRRLRVFLVVAFRKRVVRGIIRCPCVCVYMSLIVL